MNNPFMREMPGGAVAGTVDAAGRIQDVRRFDRQQCLAARQVPGLQKTVEKAINARLRRIARQEARQ